MQKQHTALKLSKWGALTFRDHTTERQYQDEHQKQVIQQTATLSIAGVTAALMYLPIDHYYVTDSALTFTYITRLFVLAPATLFGVLGYFWLKNTPQIYYRIYCVLGIPVQLMFPIMVFLSEGSAHIYGSIAQIQIAVFILVLMRAPMDFVVPSFFLILGSFIASISIYPIRTPDYLLALMPLIGVTAFSLIVAYRTDYDSRRAFLIRRELYNLRQSEAQQQHELNSWLTNLSRFLRHEFRNAMLGVSTSLDRLDRVKSVQDNAKYIKRARSSLDFMRNVLNQTAEAASVSAALDSRQSQWFDLSEHLCEWVEGYQDNFSAVDFKLQFQRDVCLLGNPIQIQQLMDKLITNAVEHRNQDSPIMISLSLASSGAKISVANYGDTLSLDIDELTTLFKGTKSTSTNLGLGLYVVRKLVEEHDGQLSAQSTTNEPGAEFLVSFPPARVNKGKPH